MELLKQLCKIQAPSGDEGPMKDFVLNYIKANQSDWKVQPQIIEGEEFQDCIILVFGKPRTAIFAHLDSIGFTVKYNKELVKIGGPRIKHNYVLVGKDSKGEIECEMSVSEGSQKAYYKYDREIDRGTQLVFKSDFRTSDEFVQSCYMDNRLGVYNALKVAETLEDGIICFSCYEEAGGGAVGYLGKYIFENYQVRQALISDITWVTDGVKHGKGVAVSMRDSGIPRRKYLNKIIELAKASGIDFQLEVEDAGGSDGNQLQKSSYPFDWCFVGAPEDNVHTPDEKVHKHDIDCMIKMYQYLMKNL
ncbi:M20/M25/M40 family metallo-hydrolase [Flexithrix dorotheae]|uniref:M20/M25/M40 family metallo-hydrolase n=1 Tax=Flexithrix dorotheae TaxID=70993 RepID=UPI000366D5E2|nr:M20/M25/M40 family metallo-hydrolase [Flexithrix dorotheae]